MPLHPKNFKVATTTYCGWGSFLES